MKFQVKILCISISILLLATKGHASSSTICSQELVVGIEKESVRPFISNKGPAQINMKEGFIVDLLGEIAHALCPNKEIHSFFKLQQADFDELFKRIHIERYDLIAGPISINAPFKERDNVAYSYPFYQDAGIVIALKDQHGVIDNEDAIKRKIKNKTVVVQKETTGYQVALLLNEEGLNLNIVLVENENQLFSIRDSFAIIHNYPILQYHITTYPTIKAQWDIIKIKADTPFFLQRAQYGFVVAKHNFELLNALNKGLTQLENQGKLDLLEKCWVDNRVEACGRRYEGHAVDVKGTVEIVSKSESKTGKLDILGNKGKTKFVNIDLEGELTSGKCQLLFPGKDFRLFERLELPRPFCGLRALFVDTPTPLLDYFLVFPRHLWGLCLPGQQPVGESPQPLSGYYQGFTGYRAPVIRPVDHVLRHL